MPLSDIDRLEFKKLVAEAISESASDGCCASRCMERCGLTPSLHAQQHREWMKFSGLLDGCLKTAGNGFVKAIVALIVLSMAIGFWYVIKHWQPSI